MTVHALLSQRRFVFVYLSEAIIFIVPYKNKFN